VEREAVQRVDGSTERRAAERLFHRDLPGGGYVAIDAAERVRTADERTVRLIVERRADRGRRHGHSPPVLREERWGSVAAGGEGGFGDLFRLARDNAALARELMALRATPD
jgi:IS5 family transposase